MAKTNRCSTQDQSVNPSDIATVGPAFPNDARAVIPTPPGLITTALGLRQSYRYVKDPHYRDVDCRKA